MSAAATQANPATPAVHTLYCVDGPHRAQDGRPVWRVVRPIEGTWRTVTVGEALSPALAQTQADALNAAALRGQEIDQ